MSNLLERLIVKFPYGKQWLRKRYQAEGAKLRDLPWYSEAQYGLGDWTAYLKKLITGAHDDVSR